MQCIVFNFTHPQLGSLKVSEYGNIIWLSHTDFSDAVNDSLLVFMCTMRKIQPEHIHTGPYQLEQFLITVACGAYGGNNFCSVGCMLMCRAVVHVLVKVFANVFAHGLFCSVLNEKTAGALLLFLISTGEDLDDLHPLITDFLFGFYRIV